MHQDRGWRCFPLRPASKKPRRGLKWKESFNGEWQDGEGVGLHLGPSGVVDVDFDWPETTGWAELFFKEHDCVFGRGGIPTHVLVKADIDKRIKYALPKSFDSMLPPAEEGEDDEHRFMVMEIRAGDHYTMIPPSTHPNGQKLEFIFDNEPQQWDAKKLRRYVGTIAFLATCERFWANGGSRHDCALALAAILKRAGWEHESVRKMFDVILSAMNDEEHADRLRAVDDTFKRDHVSGWEKLVEAFAFPEDAPTTFKRWLGIKSEKEPIDPDTLEEFNKQYAVIRNKNKVGVLIEDRDPILDRTAYSIVSQSGFKLLFPGPDALVWLASLPPLRRTYLNGFIFEPSGNAPDGFFNLWRGWSVEPKPGNWSLTRQHIEFMAREDPDYAIKWLAWLFQNPGQQAEVVLVFRGPKGSGKGTLGRLLIDFVGQNGIHISNRHHLTSNFNAHMRDCVVLFADEAFWPGDKTGEGVLKAIVTETMLPIESKGIDVTSVKNMLHIVIASNEDWVVPATMDERRFAIFNVLDDHVGDLAYFKALYEELDNGGRAAMLHDLLNMDLGDWHPRQEVPCTEGLRDQIRQSERPEVATLREILELGQCPGTRSDLNDQNELLFPDFKERVVRHAYGRNVTDVAMANSVKNRLPVIQADNNGTKFVAYNEQSGKPMTRRVKRYVLDDLEACRQAFDPKAKWPRDPSRWEWEVTQEGENDLPPEVVKDPPF